MGVAVIFRLKNSDGMFSVDRKQTRQTEMNCSSKKD